MRYVVEGSVRRAGDDVRINAQLIDAATGGHIWAERYDGTVTNVFDLQDEVTAKVIAALAIRLNPEEHRTQIERYTDNPAAYDLFLKGWSHLLQLTVADNAKALELFKQAVDLFPSNTAAYETLIELQIYAGQSATALQLADKAMKLDPKFPGEKLFLKGMAHFALQQPEEAVRYIERARLHNPAELGTVYSFLLRLPFLRNRVQGQCPTSESRKVLESRRASPVTGAMLNPSPVADLSN